MLLWVKVDSWDLAKLLGSKFALSDSCDAAKDYIALAVSYRNFCKLHGLPKVVEMEHHTPNCFSTLNKLNKTKEVFRCT